ncbi:hypothetical protein MMC14_008277, partial [Varicellaria rhodocarpa]|nr:hypothetical protein [Varicellaria rhodocarpa]
MLEDQSRIVRECVDPVNQSFGFARDDPNQPELSDFRIAFVSGPHDSTAPAVEYGKGVMIANGFGIAAQLPLLKELIQGSNRAEVQMRDIHS